VKLAGREGTPPLQQPVADLQVLVRGAVDHGGPVLIAVDGLSPLGGQGRHGLEAGDLVFYGFGVLDLEHGGLGPGAAGSPETLPGPYLEHVAAQVADFRGHLDRGPLAQGDHGDDRRHADDHAEDGEERAQEVAADRAHREQKGVPEHQPAPSWRWSLATRPSTKRTTRLA